MMETQMTWGWLIAIYLFLGGLSAGVFFTVSILRLAGKGSFTSTMTFGSWFAAVALAVGLICLVADVEKPFQALIMFQSFVNFSSWMAIGAWLIFAAFIVFSLAAIFSTDKITRALGKLWKPFETGSSNVVTVLAIIGIPVSLAVAIYTGVLLGAAPSIPLWNTWLLPTLFTVSALDTGIAAVLIYMAAREKDSGVHRVHVLLERCIVVLVLLELMIVGIYLATMLGGSVSQKISAELITAGPLQVPFWALVIAIGLIVPLIAGILQQYMARKRGSRPGLALPVGSAVCALIGGFTLRYVILAAGIHGVMISPVATQALQGIFFFVS